MQALAWTIVLALAVGAEDQDSKKLQGNWVATALRHGDAETPKEELDKGGVTLTVKGDRFIFKTPKETHEGKLDLNSSGSPKTLDLKIEGTEGKMKTIQCIYEWDGENLRIAGDQGMRPKDFKSKLGGSIVVTFKRAKD